MFRFLPRNYWSLLLQIFNTSFTEARFPDSWKEVKMWLLAKKESVCLHDSTRPISLLNTFLKIDEKLFLTRFQDLLHRRDQISSLMSNSSPVATIFVDFKSAFDQLWYEGCLGKLRKMGIPVEYLRWIESWLRGRRAYIEVN
ncbi:unnamed protein product, partial [Rotaria sp. Silwood2]